MTEIALPSPVRRPGCNASVRAKRQILVAMGLLVGLGAGIGAVIFRYLINGFTYVFFDVVATSACRSRLARPPSCRCRRWAGSCLGH